MRRCEPRDGGGKAGGFTLVEVLVALVIVSIGMVAVIQAVSQAAGNSAYLRDKTIAHWVAMNQLTLMRLSLSPPPEGTSSGETEMAGQQWKWTAEVVATPVTSMKRIDVAVRYADADEKSQLATITGFSSDKLGKPGTLIAHFTPTAPTPNFDRPPQTPRQPLTPRETP